MSFLIPKGHGNTDVTQSVRKLYPAARRNPVANGEERKAQGHHQHNQTLDGCGLLPQPREVLVPDGQELLLAVGVSHKLGGERGRRVTMPSATVRLLNVRVNLLKILMPMLPARRHWKVLVLSSRHLPSIFPHCSRTHRRTNVETRGRNQCCPEPALSI